MGAKYCMRLAEIQPAKSIKPQTPDQQRVASLQVTADRAKTAVKAERERQKMQKAQQSLATLRKAGV
jgi:hypothetical protein